MTTDDAGSARETDTPSGSAPTEPAPYQQPAWRRRLAPRGLRPTRTRRGAWRAWRRSRPFWGGVLLVLAGLELLAIPLSGILVHGAVKLVIYIGIGGVFGVLIGVLLIVAGIALWANPAHRLFYGIAGIVLGIASFPASNLGGFFLGMLLAIIGGSLGFAWTPAEAPPVPAAPDDSAALDDPTVGIDLITGAYDKPAGEASGENATDEDAEHREAEPEGAGAGTAAEPDAEPAGEPEPVREQAGEPVPGAELSAGRAARR